MSTEESSPSRPSCLDPDSIPPFAGELGAERSLLAGGLVDLVHHRSFIDASITLAEVQKIYQSNPNDFLAILDGGDVVGLCSRATVGFMLGSRYGFALYGNKSVMSARAPRPLIYRSNESLSRVLDEALSRTGSEFFEDIALVDEDGQLVGLVPVPSLARLQLQLFGEQLNRAVKQDGEMRQQNMELFQINNQLRQSQGRYKALFENNALGVALLDTKGAVVAHNHRFEQLFRLGEQAPRPSGPLQDWVIPSDRLALTALLTAHEREAPSTERAVGRFRFDLPDGPRHFELHSSWVAETGQICIFVEDITEQRLLEHRIARQEKQNMLDTLVAGVAHELNNKLTPVLGFADLLQAIAPESMKGHTHSIQQCASEAAQIIRQLLNLSRPSGGAPVALDLGQVCRDATQMLRFQFVERHCELTLSLPDVPVWVRGEAAPFKQVIINLLLNALHAMESMDKPRLALSLHKDHAFIHLRVRDVGVGISPENIARIFDPFFTTKGPRGTGLGLSVSLSIVQQHGGEILAESVPGQGSTFTVRLPVCDTSAVIEAPKPERLSAMPNGLAEGRKRALVVDDEEFVRQFMQEALRFCFGCSVDGAEDGLEAVEKLRHEKYDLILSDIRMPRMDGFQLRRWLVETHPELTERLIFVTGHPGAVDLDQSLGLFQHPVIRKPFTMDTIAATCRPILERTEARVLMDHAGPSQVR